MSGTQKNFAGINNANFACLDTHLDISAKQEASYMAECFDRGKISSSLREMSLKKLLGKLGSLGF